MAKLWRVVVYEYTRHVLRRRFLFALLSVPAMIAVMALVGFLIVRLQTKTTPIGYVDYSGLLANPISAPPPSPPGRPIPMVPVPNEEVAREVLESGQLQAYYVLAADYRQSSHARLVYIEEPKRSAQEQFEDFLRANLLAGQPPAVAERVTQGSQMTVRSVDGRRHASERDWFNLFTNFAAGLAFIIAIFTSSGYLMQAVVEEKENRTMEMMITSISPAQMMTGKILGILGVGVTQLLVWAVVAVIVVLAGRSYFEWMKSIHLAPETLGLILLVMSPGFVLVAALMATVGATVTEEREAQQMTGLFTLPVIAPYWFAAQIMGNPNGPLAVGLSYFPLTAPVALTMRAGLTAIPAGQLALSLGLLILSAIGALWLAGRAFRLGMLRFGQRVTWKEIIPRRR